MENFYEEEEKEYPCEPNLAIRRKNEWKFAQKHAQILIDQEYELEKDMGPDKNWSISDQKKINSMKVKLRSLNVNLE